MAHIAWITVRDDYVQGVETDGIRIYPTLADLAAKYGCNITTLKRKCAKEDWLLLRSQFATKVAQGRDERRADELSGESALFDLECYRTAKLAVAAAKHGLEMFHGKPTDDERFLRLVTAVERAQRIGRLALGDDTERIRSNHPIFKPKFDEL